ncbi:hypothetical protein D9G21_26695, partial [Escherichia coli]|nr:hypothetical protein [Escherichia coli]
SHKEFAQPLSVFIFISETPGRNKIYFISPRGWTTSKARRQSGGRSDQPPEDNQRIFAIDLASWSSRRGRLRKRKIKHAKPVAEAVAA